MFLPFTVETKSLRFSPGVIKTNIHTRGGLSAEQYAKVSLCSFALQCTHCAQFLEHSKTTHALGRVGDVLETARAIAFLVRSEGSYT